MGFQTSAFLPLEARLSAVAWRPVYWWVDRGADRHPFEPGPVDPGDGVSTRPMVPGQMLPTSPTGDRPMTDAARRTPDSADFAAYLRALPKLLKDGNASRVALIEGGRLVSVWDTA